MCGQSKWPSVSLSDLTSGPHFQLGLNAGLGYERVNTGSIQAWVCLLMLLQQLDNRLEKEYKKEYKKKKSGIWEKRNCLWCLLLLPTNAENAPEENAIFWFSSDVYWSTVADMILCSSMKPWPEHAFIILCQTLCMKAIASIAGWTWPVWWFTVGLLLPNDPWSSTIGVWLPQISFLFSLFYHNHD